MTPFDLIGDIHGHTEKLEGLLRKLGYRLQGGHYGHPERRAVFVGDFIDRGPQIRESLQIVRTMVDAGSAAIFSSGGEGVGTVFLER